MGNIITWCKHCHNVISHRQDETSNSKKDEYSVCATCKRKYSTQKKCHEKDTVEEKNNGTNGN